MIQITCSQAKKFLENIIRNHKKHTGIFAINPLNKKTTPAARAAFERSNTFSYEFAYKKNGIIRCCRLERITYCPNNDIVFYENYVIDIGVVRIERGKIVKTYESLVRPPVSVPPSITRLTGLRSEDLVQAPSFEDILSEIEPLFEGAIFTAHNAPFDYGFLNLEYLRAGKQFLKPLLCTKNLVHKALPELPKHTLPCMLLLKC